MHRAELVRALGAWFAAHARDLPWRAPDTTAYGVLVSEVMSQQTPVARVAEPWRQWVARWPTPRALAEAPTAHVLRAWGTLGYPRRALRLQEAARAIVDRHDGVVPRDIDELTALPGVGAYTAAAVACFHYKQHIPAIDTNVRRVAHRYFSAQFLTPPPRVADKTLVARFMPTREDPADVRALAATVPLALMELGALVCQARAAHCDACPLAPGCAWVAAGKPAPTAEQLRSKRVQKFTGTDRQCRGRIMAALRAAPQGVTLAEVAWENEAQKQQCAESLVADGLARAEGARLLLP
ncbi:adenine glycosylase [Corynebacterium sp. 13CS0277]|uniref:A/G-specific adenine glycosylase n=1 Tax=Corynebacterium sp. 13CS0277 TaxID=2071994 RepID=UPI000D03F00C|nr:A/G-specific adenine glycosylase [Corynebacterium sp. 13CS0277]PRQ11524.1 adenine glycosylase [Corynebacterium sp. 13CS0277]